ncbi:MAG: hypothetical protein GOP50_03465 [Candidatus Heimdallarchaeota archaeon]|nr:hypothetical protein [Candidatus Heimdallarchaeota archaeon]
MSKIKKRKIFCVFLLLLLLLQGLLRVNGEIPVIASRVSGIIEISLVLFSGDIGPNKTLFNINVGVEVLNRETENYTGIDLSDCWPKVLINATFVNQSFELEQDIMCHATGMYYDYRPGITREYEKFEFYINQSDLTRLPDGNYTLWRPINTASSLGWVDPAEVLYTKIEISSGDLDIFYPDFGVFTIPELSIIFPLTLITTTVTLWVILLHRKRKDRKKVSR